MKKHGRFALGWMALLVATGGGLAAAERDATPLQAEIRTVPAGALNARRNARFQRRLGACLAAEGVAYQPPPATGDGAAVDPSVADAPALPRCLAEATEKRDAETGTLLAALGPRLAALDRHPSHVAALRRYAKCMKQTTGRRLGRPEDAHRAIEAALEAAEGTLETTPTVPTDRALTQTERAALDDATQRVRERNLQRLKEARVATNSLAAADEGCQGASGLAQVRAALVGDVVREAEREQPALMDSIGGMP